LACHGCVNRELRNGRPLDPRAGWDRGSLGRGPRDRLDESGPAAGNFSTILDCCQCWWAHTLDAWAPTRSAQGDSRGDSELRRAAWHVQRPNNLMVMAACRGGPMLGRATSEVDVWPVGLATRSVSRP